jgi:hypothetical protein
MHKSQGDGSTQRRGSAVNYFQHWDGTLAEKEIFDGVDLTWNRIPGGAAVGAILTRAAADFDPARPAAIVPALLRAHAEMSKLGEDPLVARKREEVREVIRAASGLWLEAIAPQTYTTAGSTVNVKATVINRSDLPLRLTAIRGSGITSRELSEVLANNRPFQADVAVAVPADARPSGPYWLQGGMDAPLYPAGDHRADAEAPLGVTFAVEVDGQTLEYRVPVLYRWTDRIQGDQYRNVEVIPAASIHFAENVLLFPNAGNRGVRLTVRAENDGVSGQLRLRLPNGWGSKPEVEAIDLPKKGDEVTVSFAIAPTATPSAGSAVAELKTAAGTISTELTTIDYDHIPVQTLFLPAAVRLVREDVKIGRKNVGYIMGAGDDVPQSLRQMGFDVTLLSDEQIASGDLSRFDTIVAGVRAYNTNAALKRSHRRLIQYVENGGRYVVQYQTGDETMAKEIGPFPFRVTRERVTDETAPVTILEPGHQLFTWPNAITPRDFEGWVQERGLTFARDHDPRYQTVMASHDPGEPDHPGGTLVAKVGKGTYIYSSYAWFRQLPAGVPGAYRLFANLVSAGQP